MATIIHIHGHSHAASKQPSKFFAYYNKIVDELEEVYFGFIAMVIAIGSAIGGISLMFLFENHAPLWEMAIGISFCLANNIIAILQFHTRWVLDLFLLTVIVNGILIIVNVI